MSALVTDQSAYAPAGCLWDGGGEALMQGLDHTPSLGCDRLKPITFPPAPLDSSTLISLCWYQPTTRYTHFSPGHYPSPFNFDLDLSTPRLLGQSEGNYLGLSVRHPTCIWSGMYLRKRPHDRKHPLLLRSPLRYQCTVISEVGHAACGTCGTASPLRLVLKRTL